MTCPALMMADRAFMAGNGNIPRLFRGDYFFFKSRPERHAAFILTFLCRTGVFLQRETPCEVIYRTDHPCHFYIEMLRAPELQRFLCIRDIFFSLAQISLNFFDATIAHRWLLFVFCMAN
ncbi:hypothetical protein D3C76_880610 [compost metagenome]